MQKVHVRKLIRVTKQAHVRGLIKEIYPPLVLSSNEVVFDIKGMIVAWLIKDTISPTMLSTLEKSAKKCPLGHYKEDSRGDNKKATLGSMIERGGSGKIHPQDDKTTAGKSFLHKNKLLIAHLSQIMSDVTPVQSFLVDYVPEKHRVMKKFSVCFWNRTPIGRLMVNIVTRILINYLNTVTTHRDTRDWFYCWIVPFGNWTGGNISLKYNNIQVFKDN